MNKSNHHNKRESDSGIDHIFHHEKCSEFDDETKEKVITAYRLAVTLHRTQRRHNNKPYIDHINRSIDLYLDNTLSSSERCNPEYIIALILHDCIEDNENGLREIIKK